MNDNSKRCPECENCPVCSKRCDKCKKCPSCSSKHEFGSPYALVNSINIDAPPLNEEIKEIADMLIYKRRLYLIDSNNRKYDASE